MYPSSFSSFYHIYHIPSRPYASQWFGPLPINLHLTHTCLCGASLSALLVDHSENIFRKNSALFLIIPTLYHIISTL